MALALASQSVVESVGTNDGACQSSPQSTRKIAGESCVHSASVVHRALALSDNVRTTSHVEGARAAGGGRPRRRPTQLRWADQRTRRRARIPLKVKDFLP